MQRPDLNKLLNHLTNGNADRITADEIEELILYIEHLEYLDKECNRRF